MNNNNWLHVNVRTEGQENNGKELDRSNLRINIFTTIGSPEICIHYVPNVSGFTYYY